MKTLLFVYMEMSSDMNKRHDGTLVDKQGTVLGDGVVVEESREFLKMELGGNKFSMRKLP